ncbi:MAG: DUF134 domain-containing protein [Candidatus Omnitrophota bacterium]|nr:DUF134 domain-containing protein [Candidatus Omnitrophota bacterium]MDZ4242856.1 DUF134 domain-containing protein [Candidatus Omnitrophota bacterium]
MRPKKTRWIACEPGERCFQPKCKAGHSPIGVHVTLDEFEALRLAHLEKLEQTEIARLMRIHRSTVSRILTSAHRKIADALVNLKAIRIEGGCCVTRKEKRH